MTINPKKREFESDGDYDSGKKDLIKTFKSVFRNEGSMKYVSPKMLAQVAGVSESSIKRWCDQGDIKMEKTNGGHRRITLPSATEFLRRMGQASSRHLLELPIRNLNVSSSITDTSQRFFDAIVSGDEEVCRRIIFHLHQNGEQASRIFDEIIAPAFRCIGTGWECHEVEIYQERRACGISLHIIDEWRQRIPAASEKAPLAIGGSVETDPYSLPTAMVETVLRQLGWRSRSLGSRLPFQTLIAAINDLKPDLFWLSVSHLEDQQRFLEEFRDFYQSIGETVPVMVGGRALTDRMRQKMQYSCFCDNLQHLETFVGTLFRPRGRRKVRKTKNRERVSSIHKRSLREGALNAPSKSR